MCERIAVMRHGRVVEQLASTDLCHGMQVIGECLGGTVAKDLPGMNAAVTPHIPSSIPDELAHDILIEPDSDLFAWHREEIAKVNSLHRHALMGDGRFRVSAWATDGLIEAFDGVAGGFCLGVQWHPEYRLTRLDRTILAAFVGHCTRHANAALSPDDGSRDRLPFVMVCEGESLSTSSGIDSTAAS